MIMMLNKKMININSEYKKKFDYFFIILLFVGINLFTISKIKMVAIIGDEINTLAIPALFTKNLWRNLHPSYYGWGGVIFYTPLFMLIKNPITLYQSIIFINTLLLSLIPCVSYYILDKFFFIKERKTRLLVSIFVGIYPGNFSMIQYGWNEIWLRLVVWVILLFLMKIIFEEKKRNLNSLIIGILLAYSYAIHGRMLALFPTILIIYIVLKKEKILNMHSILYFVYGFIPMLLIDFILKKKIIKILFGNKNLIRNTFMDTIINTLKVIFKKEIIIDMMRATMSHVFYLGITSFGIIFLGCVILIRLLKKYKNNEISSDRSLLIMGIFSIVGSIFLILTTIFFFSTIFKNGTSFIFGRYNDTLSSIVIFFVIITILKQKSGLENIYYVFSSLLIIGIPFLLIEPMNEANSKIGDVSLLTLLSFVPGNKFNSPEKLYMVILFLLMISIYMLVTLNRKILLSIFTGIVIYSISNINLAYIRINADNRNFSIIKNKYEILNRIPSEKFSLNVVRDFYTDYYSYLYIMLFHNYNVNYQTKDIVENILSGTEEYSVARKEQESLFISKNIYKVTVQNDNDEYDLYFKKNSRGMNFLLNQKDIHIELHNMLEIPLDNFFTTDGNGKSLEKIILSRKNKIFGPYINLRPSKYKIIINGENLNQNGINIYGTYKKSEKDKDKVATFYKIISNNFNEIVGEINENNFLYDFELIIENNSNSEIEIKTIKIITEN